MKRFNEIVFEIVSFICWVAFILSSVYGLSVLLGKYSLFACLALLFVLSSAFSKKKEEEKKRLKDIVRQQLDHPEYDNLSSLAKHDILQIIEHSKD